MRSLLIPLLFVLLPFTATFAHADACIGKVLSDSGQLLFNFKREETLASGMMKIENTYTTPGGAVAVRESVEMIGGDRLKRFVQDRIQSGEKGELDVTGAQMKFSYTRGGKTETESESVPKNLVIGPSIIPFLQAHWDDLMKGATLDTRLAVLDRKETVGFKFFKDSEDAEHMTVKMKPTSFVIAAIVNPLFFTFDRKTRRATEMRGRLVPKVQRDGKWVDMDGKLTFAYPAPSVAGGAPAPASTPGALQ